MGQEPRSFRWAKTPVTGLFVAFFALTASAGDLKPAAEPPETVLCTYHVKAGRASAFTASMAKGWALYRHLDLVVPQPHIIVRGTEPSGQVYFAEIFTWKSADIPDNAPAEVQAFWGELNGSCEPRGGKPGIDIVVVQPVSSAN
jgi:hypothetical protein